MTTAAAILRDLRAVATPEKAAELPRFFKTPTALRYAIERFPREERSDWLARRRAAAGPGGER